MQRHGRWLWLVQGVHVPQHPPCTRPGAVLTISGLSRTTIPLLRSSRLNTWRSNRITGSPDARKPEPLASTWVTAITASTGQPKGFRGPARSLLLLACVPLSVEFELQSVDVCKCGWGFWCCGNRQVSAGVQCEWQFVDVDPRTGNHDNTLRTNCNLRLTTGSGAVGSHTDNPCGTSTGCTKPSSEGDSRTRFVQTRRLDSMVG